MHKSSVAVTQKPPAPQLNAKSAWAKGPPSQPLTTTSSNSLPTRGPSPNGSATPATTPSHSRKSSAFAPAVAVKDGAMSRGIAGSSHRSTPSLNFGSIDATTPPTPSASNTSVSAVNGSTPTPLLSKELHAPVKVFGSVNVPASSSPLASSSTSPAANASPTPSNVSSVATSAAAPRRRLDPNKFFQIQTSQSSAGPSTSTPSAALPAPSSAVAFPPQTHPNANPTSMAPNPAVNSPQQRYPALPPSAHHQQFHSPVQQNQQVPPQHLRSTAGTAGAGGPRSPNISRMSINGVPPGANGLNTNGGPGPGRGPQQNGQPQPGSGQMSSPRLGGQPPLAMPHQQQPQQPPPVPQPGQMQGQGQYPPHMGPNPGWQQPPYPTWQTPYQQYPYMMPQEGWYPPPHMQHHMNHPHIPSPYNVQSPSTPLQPFPQQVPSNPQQPPLPNGSNANTNGMPMSPRNGPIPALAPQTTGSSAPPPVNTNIPPSQQQQQQSNQTSLRTHLTAGAREFVPSVSPVVPSAGFPLPPKKSSAVRITRPDGEPISLRPPDGHHGLGHVRNMSRVRLESEEAKAKRLAEEEAAQRKAKEEAEAKNRQEEEEKEKERKRKEDEEKEVKRKAEEAERLKKEEEERVRKEEEERIKKEEEERVRKLEEEQRLQREEEERIQREEQEKRAKAEAEAKAKAEEERIRKETEEAEAQAAAKAKVEAEAKEKEEKEQAAAAAAAAAATTTSPPPALTRTSSTTSASASPKPFLTSLPAKPSLPLITTGSDRPRPQRPVPGPLDLSTTHRPGLAPSLPSALASARMIENLDSINYPEGIKTPDLELNQGAEKGGKYKYDREFLLQFMTFCKDKPDNLPSLEPLGIERGEGGEGAGNFNSSGRSQSRRTMSAMGPPASVRPASVGLGIGLQFPGKANPFANMGQFQTPSRLSSEDRFAMSTRAASGSAAFPPGRPPPMSRTTSQGGVGGQGMRDGGAGAVPQSPRADRTRSQRGRSRNESLKPNAAPPQQQSQQYGGGNNQYNNNQMNSFGLEPVAPLQATENRWTPASLSRKPAAVAEDSPLIVERKVKGLLNKLTLEKFDSISGQIIAWANKSENEKNGQTLIHVIKLVFEKATDEATFSEMYARLCRKMMETISTNVQDDSIKNADGKPIVGGNLFRKYLLNRCQEDFERGWSAKESAAAAAALKAADDKAAAEAHAASAGKEEEVVLYSDEYYAALKAKRQGLGLVKFIGELFKLQMLTERIMHECIKKLLSKIDDPEEEEIESLCKLLTTVGQSLDTPKAKNHMDIYFQRMDTLTRNPQVISRVRYMLLDVIDLRKRNWQARQNIAAPTTIAQVHEQAAKEKAEASQILNRNAMSRGGSRRGEHSRGSDFGQPGPDGWNVAGPTPVRPPAKAGDLSNFGKFNSKTSGGPMLNMGPSSVFKKGDRGRDTPPPSSISRAGSTVNMFSALLAGGETLTDASMQRTASGRGSTRKPSVDLNQAGTVPDTPMRKKLQLLPRSAPIAAEKDGDDHSDDGTDIDAVAEDAPPAMTDAQVTAKVAEDVKEIFTARDVAEAEACFKAMPEEHKSKLVDKLVVRALESKEADVKLVAASFAAAADADSCSPLAFEAGLAGTIEFLDDISIDAPQAYNFMARLLRGAKLAQATVEALADKIAVDGDPVVHPRDKLLKAYASLA